MWLYENTVKPNLLKKWMGSRDILPEVARVELLTNGTAAICGCFIDSEETTIERSNRFVSSDKPTRMCMPFQNSVFHMPLDCVKRSKDQEAHQRCTHRRTETHFALLEVYLRCYKRLRQRAFKQNNVDVSVNSLSQFCFFGFFKTYSKIAC